MRSLSRRAFIATAASHGAVPAFAQARSRPGGAWREVGERFPQGVASADPGPDSILLWTRRAPAAGEADARLVVEVAEDEGFERVVARRSATVSSAADWTCRVLVGGLEPSRTYWYRFTDTYGSGSRIGRTRTAPAHDDGRPVRFAFVSCQNVNLGPLNAWRRMVFDDRKAADEVEFVLHLGDFVYDDVWRAADHPQGYFDRRVRDAFTYPDGETQGDVVVAASLEDYRTLYRAYLEDPDLQAARARWPFVAIWDNGEFSDKGWQGMQRFGEVTRPAQTRKVAANQAWFEYVPSRAVTLDGSLRRFHAPTVTDAPVVHFDDAGLGLQADNLAAIGSLRGYRAQRWGLHVELLLTDQRSYRSNDYTAAPEAKAMASARFPQMVPFESLQAIDAGRTWPGGPPATLRFAEHATPNFRKDAAPRTLLGAEQKVWFLNRLACSRATWKIWADTVATLDMRADPQHLPPGLTERWPGAGYAGYARTDHSTAYAERGEIYDLVVERGITGFVTLSGDRHSFWAGLAAKALPPESFRPVGLSFVVGSISSPGMVEAFEYTLPKTHPLRALYLIDRPGAAKPEPSVNLLLKHGVRTCLDYAAHSDLSRAKALSDPGLAPHVAFVDMGGHGYAVVTATAERIATEFVCIPRPVDDGHAPDGGPLRYRVTHAADLWTAGEAPTLRQTGLEGDAGLSV